MTDWKKAFLDGAAAGQVIVSTLCPNLSDLERLNDAGKANIEARFEQRQAQVDRDVTIDIRQRASRTEQKR